MWSLVGGLQKILTIFPFYFLKMECDWKMWPSFGAALYRINQFHSQGNKWPFVCVRIHANCIKKFIVFVFVLIAIAKGCGIFFISYLFEVWKLMKINSGIILTKNVYTLKKRRSEEKNQFSAYVLLYGCYIDKFKPMNNSHVRLGTPIHSWDHFKWHQILNFEIQRICKRSEIETVLVFAKNMPIVD